MIILRSTPILLGNRCGHDPNAPRWFEPPENHRTRPGILVKLIEAIRAYYESPTSTIPSLNLANDSDRKQRSERRESCITVLSALIHYTDLVTLRIGIPQADGSIQGITMEFIAQRCGLGLRRTERALADLVAAGIITVSPLVEKIADDVYKGSAAIRTVSKALFALFGFAKRLKWERKKAAARRRKAERKIHEQAQAKIDLLSRSADRKRHQKDEHQSPDVLPEETKTASGFEPLSPRERAFRDIRKILSDP